MTTVYQLATDINPDDPGQGVNSIIGYLGHRDGLTPDSELDPQDEADVRQAFA